MTISDSVHVEALVVKAVEEAAIPGDVIFAAAAEHERAVEALGEIGDGRIGRNRARQSVVGIELFRELGGHRVQFPLVAAGDADA